MLPLYIYLDLRYGYARRIAEGAARYASPHLRAHLVGPDEMPWRVPTDRPCGLISTAQALRELPDGIPANCHVVNVSSKTDDDGFPTVQTDNEAVGRMAAAHLCGAGLRQFLFVGDYRFHYTHVREAAFRRELARRHELDVQTLDCQPGAAPDWPQALGLILKQRKCPVAVLAATDFIATHVLELATQIDDLRVPDDLAILGIDRDPVCSTCAHIPLSSIELNGHKVGEEAARYLEQQLVEAVAVGPLPRHLRVPPRAVQARQSTNRLHSADPVVAQALSQIESQLSEGVDVPELVRHSGLSRRSFETRFRQVTSRSPHEAILHARMSRAKELLVTTRLTIAEVAEACGFAAPRDLSYSFRRREATTPSDYRARYQHQQLAS